MKTSTLIILLCVTAAIIAAAALVSNKGRAKPQAEVATELLFPNLAARVNDVAVIEIKRANAQYSFRRTDKGWEVADRGGYPAKIEKIKETLIALSQLKALEAKTSRPENYSKIGVEDPGTAKPEPSTDPTAPAPTSNATQLTLKDDKGQTINAVIIGNPKWDAKPGSYLRKVGEAQAWLADGRIDAPTEFTSWVDTQFASIPRDRIKSAEITFPDGAKTRISRETKDDASFTVHDVPPGEELMGSNAGDAIGAALGFLSFENVAPVAEIFPPIPATPGENDPKRGPSSEFLTFDGMKILVQTAEKDGKMWANFVSVYDDAAAPPVAEPKPGEAASRKPEEVQKEITEFNDKAAKWAYQLPDYKASAFKTTVASMLKSRVPTPPPSLNQGNQAESMNPMPLPAPTQPAPAATEPPSPAPQPETQPESPVKPPENPPEPTPQPTPAPTGG